MNDEARLRYPEQRRWGQREQADERHTVTDRSLTPAGTDRDPLAIDSSVAHTSRIYDYLLGGTDNFAIDREVAEHAFTAYPGGVEGARTDARANRAFLGRAVRYLAGEAGIRQFLDVGTGIPNANNTHAVAQGIAPESRVVYVDNDPIVLAHAHALLRGSPDGATDYLDGDLRKPAVILEQAADTLDLTKPVAVIVVGVLHVIPDAGKPYASVAALVDAVPSGSYLALSHLTNDIDTGGADMAVVTTRLDESMRTTNPPALRTRAQVTRFFDGLEIIEPGVVPAAEWRSDGETPAQPGGRITPLYGAIGRKP
jgi:S-adenosyl methyltransferase